MADKSRKQEEPREIENRKDKISIDQDILLKLVLLFLSKVISSGLLYHDLCPSFLSLFLEPALERKVHHANDWVEDD